MAETKRNDEMKLNFVLTCPLGVTV